MGAYYQPHFMYGMNANEDVSIEPGAVFDTTAQAAAYGQMYPNTMQPPPAGMLPSQMVPFMSVPKSAATPSLFSSNLVLFAVAGIAAYFLFFKK